MLNAEATSISIGRIPRRSSCALRASSCARCRLGAETKPFIGVHQQVLDGGVVRVGEHGVLEQPGSEPQVPGGDALPAIDQYVVDAVQGVEVALGRIGPGAFRL